MTGFIHLLKGSSSRYSSILKTSSVHLLLFACDQLVEFHVDLIKNLKEFKLRNLRALHGADRALVKNIPL